MESEKDNGETISRFRTRRVRQFALIPPVLLSFLVLMWSSESEDATLAGVPRNYAMATAATVALSGVMFSLFNWRCPSCSGYLGKAINPSFCAKCGAPLK